MRITFLFVAVCVAACAAATRPTSPPPVPRANPPRHRPKDTALQVVERYLQGPLGYRQAVADHRAGREDLVQAFVAKAEVALKRLVDLPRADEFNAVRALQHAYNEEQCLELYSAFQREEADPRARRRNLMMTLKSWEPVDGCVVRPGSAEHRMAIYPVVFPLVPKGSLLARIERIHRRLRTARTVAVGCNRKKRTRVFALGADNRIIAMEDVGPTEPLHLPDRFARFVVPKPGVKPPPPPRVHLILSAANQHATAKITIPHPGVRSRLQKIPDNARAISSTEALPLPLELSGLMEGDVVEASLTAPGHKSHTFKKEIKSPHHLRGYGVRVRFEDGDRWHLHFFLAPRDL